MHERDAMPLSISFDDGRIIQYKAYFPILKESDLHASFYIVTNWIGRPGFMGWEEIKDLWQSQNEIGSHSHTHRKLSSLPETELMSELEKSKEMLKFWL
jgi:peptidoglycan/xylan/chitin deacetylase (PgdA/CDA1 family)